MFLIFLLLSLTSAVIDAQCPGIIPRINVRNPVPNWTLQIYVNPPGPPVKEYFLSSAGTITEGCVSGGRWCVRVLDQNKVPIFEAWGDVAPTVPNAIADIFMCQDGRAWVLVNYGISCNNVGSPNPLCVMLRTC